MAQSTSNLLNIGNTLSTGSPAQVALTNKINPAPLQQPTALKTQSNVSSPVASSGDAQVIANQKAMQALGISNAPGVGSGTQNTQSTPQTYTPPPTNNAPITQPVPQTPTYPGLVTQIANQQNTPNNQIATQSAGALQTLAGNNPATSGVALGSYNQAVTNKQQFESNLSDQYANNASNPIPLEFQQGRAQVIQQANAQKEAQLQQAINEQQAAIGYQISGQQTQNAGYSAAGGLANSNQGLAQGALGTAAGLSAPRQNGYVLIDSLTGQPVGGNGATSAINQGAQYDAQYQGALGNATDQQAISGAKNNIASLTQLINNAGLNNSGINIQNATVQQLQKNLSNSDYATLQNSLQAINAALSKVTGTPIDIAQLSTSQGTSLITTINNAVQSAEGIAAGKVSGGGSNTSSGGLYNF